MSINVQSKVLHLLNISIIFLASKNFLYLSKGIDFSDESLYLISAKPSIKFDSYGWPFGWVTSVIYKLVGFEIETFRSVGLLILIASAYYFSWNMTLAIGFSSEESQQERAKLIAITTVGCLSSLTIYAGFIRTPGYNWLNLVSILLAVGTFLNITYFSDQNEKIKIQGKLISLGFILFLSFHAKPTTPIFLLIGFSIIWSTHFQHKQIFKFLISIFLGTFLASAIFLISGLWPLDFPYRFLEIITNPYLTIRGTIPFALIQILALPFYAIFFVLTNMSAQFALLLFILCVFLIASRILRLNARTIKYTGLVFTSLMAIIFIGLELDKKGFYLSQKQIVDRSYLPLSFIFLSFSVMSLNWEVLKFRKSLDSRFTQINLLLFLALVTFGFGSITVLLGKFSGAVIFILFFLFNLIKNLNLGTFAEFCLTLWVIFVSFILLALVYVISLNNPYRQEPILQQNQVCTVGKETINVLLDVNTCQELKDVKDALIMNHFQEHSLLLNMTDPWRPGLNLLLGLKFPRGILLSIPDYENSGEVLKRNLEDLNRKNPILDNWYLLPTPNASGKSDYLNTVSAIEFSLKGSFKENFSLIFKNSNIEIWKPLRL